MTHEFLPEGTRISGNEPPSRPRYEKLKRALLWSLGTIIVILVLFKMNEMRILRMAYEIHEPRVENEQSILSTAKRYGLDPAYVTSIDPASFVSLNKQFGGVPEVLIFDKHGNHIEYKAEPKACNAGVFGFIPALEKNGHYRMASGSLNTTIGQLRDIRGGQLRTNYIDSTADYYVLISWTSFSGKLNKDHVHVWQDMANANTKARIQVIEVNFDAQNWWPHATKDSIIKKYSRNLLFG